MTERTPCGGIGEKLQILLKHKTIRTILNIQLSLSLRKPGTKSANEDVLNKTTSDMICFLVVCKTCQFKVDSTFM